MRKERRRAVHAELVRESKDNPGYYRYNITIREEDGMEHVVPAYGKDMEDAINRLVWNERVGKVTDNKFYHVLLLFVAFTVLTLSSVIALINQKPLWVVIGIVGFILIGLIMAWLDNYLKKK